MPNRYATPPLFLLPVPPRGIVLDRYAQHTAVCPDSLNFFNKLKAVRAVAWTVALMLVAHRLAMAPVSAAGASVGAGGTTAGAAAAVIEVRPIAKQQHYESNSNTMNRS